jgi:hypothetical protein
MYQFQTLKSIYQIIIRYRKPDHSQYEYSGNMVLNAKRNKGNCLFVLEQRTDTKLNGVAPQQVMDNLMLELGNALYPIELNTDLKGEIRSIGNFSEIRERWIKKSRDLYKRNKTQAFRNYLEMSQNNLTHESRFKEVLLRDSFIQLFFLNYGNNTLRFDFVNFPVRSRKLSLHALKEPDYYSLHPAFREKDMKTVRGKLGYRTAKTGELLKMDMNLLLENDKEECYRKSVSIRSDEKKHTVKTGIFF